MKDIKNFEGKYAVDEEGRIYSYLSHRYLKPKTDKDGYLSVGLMTDDGKQKWYQVHRLVAIAFIPNPDNLPIINHKDEDKGNPRVENLEWCDYKYNSNYGSAIQKRIKPIVGKNAEGEVYFNSVAEASKALKICAGAIRNCLSGYSHTSAGYEWRYV